jgi:hypothetical protein
MRLGTKDSSTKRGGSKRLVLGFAALASAAVVGTAGLAGAAVDKPSKEQCAAAGFPSYGQCVREWAQNKNQPSSGYGGDKDTTINTNVNVGTSGDGNIIHVVINYFF